MSRPSSEETAPPAEESKQAALENEVRKTRQLIDSDVASAVLPEDAVVQQLDKEFFQSPTFQNAAYNFMPERYGNADRSLIIISLEAGAQIFVVSGKISSDNPYEVGHAVLEGVDLRGSHVLVYAYDGAETITEYTDEGTNIYTGEYGTPEALLPHIRESLGAPVGSQTYQSG